MWTVVNFGKWKDKALTLPQVVLSDPDWFFWAIEEEVFNDKKALADEAEDIAQKAKEIKIKKDNPDDWEIEYVIAHDGKFSGFNLVESSKPLHQGSSSTVRRKHLDLSFPRSMKGYDKLGCRLMLATFKYHWLGNQKKRMTKKVCEDFFDDASNFL